MSLAEQPQTRNRQRNVRRRRNAYHAPVDMTAMQRNIACVTIDHVRDGKSADWRNLAITYPMAFDMTWQALTDTERVKLGITTPDRQLKRRMVERELARLRN